MLHFPSILKLSPFCFFSFFWHFKRGFACWINNLHKCKMESFSEKCERTDWTWQLSLLEINYLDYSEKKEKKKGTLTIPSESSLVVSVSAPPNHIHGLNNLSFGCHSSCVVVRDGETLSCFKNLLLLRFMYKFMSNYDWNWF